MRTIRTLLTSLVAAAILVPAAASAAEDVDLLLVLAVDVSRSIGRHQIPAAARGLRRRRRRSARA